MQTDRYEPERHQHARVDRRLASVAHIMEDAVYLCTWSQNNGGYSLWVKSRPKLRREAGTWPEAVERLTKAIQNADEVMVAVLEFDPHPPKSFLEAKYAEPEIYLVGGTDAFETDHTKCSAHQGSVEFDNYLKSIDAFFQSPICRKCKYASSLRSNKPLNLTYVPGGYDGAFGYAGRFGSNTLRLFSEEFLGLLTPEEKQHLEFRPAIRKGRGKRFYELLGPAGPPYVAVAGLKISGWRCSECGHRAWGYWVKGLSINNFVSASDLTPFLRSVFTVGTPPEIQLAITRKRWRELVVKKGTRGLGSHLLGVVPEHEVVRVPELPALGERRLERLAGK